MKKYLTKLTAVVLALAMLLSVSAFAADVPTFSFILKSGNQAGTTADSTQKSSGDGTIWHEVTKNKGDIVYVQVLLSADMTLIPGSGTDHIWFDRDFFEFLSGPATDEPNNLAVINSVTKRDSNVGVAYTKNSNALGNASICYLKITDNLRTSLTAGSARWMATVPLRIKADTTKTEGWVYNWKGKGTSRTYYGPSYSYYPDGNTSASPSTNTIIAVQDLLVKLPDASEDYKVTCVEPKYGTLASDKTTHVGEGETVALTALPEANNGGRVLSGPPRVVDDAGNQISVTKVNDATYTFTMPAANVTATAVFATEPASTHEVTFNTNGGSAVPSQTVNDGAAASEPAAPTKDGNTFVKWQKGGVDYDFSTPVTEDITLDAVWTPAAAVTHTVTFNANGGTAVPVQTVNDGAAAAQPTAPTKDGNTFVKWQKGGVDYDFSTPVTEDITLDAVWTPAAAVTHTVTFNANGGTAVPVQTVNDGAAAAQPTAPTKDGNTFVKWQKGGVDYDFSTPVTEDITLDAVWQAKVTFDVGGGSPAPADQDVISGGKATQPTEPTKEGHTFNGWLKPDGTPWDFATDTVDGNITLTADWTPIEYTVTWKSQDGNTTLDSSQVPYGSEPAYTKAAPTKANDAQYKYTFDGWATEQNRESGVAPSELPAVTGNATYYAAFSKTPLNTETYTVTWRSQDGGKVLSTTTNVAAGSAPKYNGNTPTKSADAEYTYAFAGWATEQNRESGVAPSELPAVTGNVTYYAAFKPTKKAAATAGTTPGSPSIKPVTAPTATGVAGMLNTTDHVRYLRGYPEGDIRPGGNITRAETAQIFYRLLLYPDVTANKPFSDVPDGQWYTKAVRALAGLGIINGYEDGTFHPNAAITRAEFTAIATRFAKAANGTVSFTDVGADHWAYGNIATAAGYGWINGYEDGTFRPANTITRAETATIVNHMLGRAADGEWLEAHRSEINQFTDLQNPSIWYYLDMVEASNSHDYSMATAEKWSGVIKDEIE